MECSSGVKKLTPSCKSSSNESPSRWEILNKSSDGEIFSIESSSRLEKLFKTVREDKYLLKRRRVSFLNRFLFETPSSSWICIVDKCRGPQELSSNLDIGWKPYTMICISCGQFSVSELGRLLSVKSKFVRFGAKIFTLLSPLQLWTVKFSRRGHLATRYSSISSLVCKCDRKQVLRHMNLPKL